jgi:hypothetical protein
VARDEWYDRYEAGAITEEAALREAAAGRPERPGPARPVPTAPGDCHTCQAPLREIDWGCLTCGIVLRTPLRCVSEERARALGWIE